MPRREVRLSADELRRHDWIVDTGSNVHRARRAETQAFLIARAAEVNAVFNVENVRRPPFGLATGTTAWIEQQQRELDRLRKESIRARWYRLITKAGQVEQEIDYSIAVIAYNRAHKLSYFRRRITDALFETDRNKVFELIYKAYDALLTLAELYLHFCGAKGTAATSTAIVIGTGIYASVSGSVEVPQIDISEAPTQAPPEAPRNPLLG